MKSLLLFTILQAVTGVQAAAVFAHFMVGNTQDFTISDWQGEIALAIAAHIEAFALNIANGWEYNAQAMSLAFAAAETMRVDDGYFKLFFSFDYAGNGPWASSDVTSLISTYSGSAAYYKYDGKPFVSTFEGPDNADDWKGIKASTGCFFMPDWSSVGAGPALSLGDGVADGLFSWAAWPWGTRNTTTFVDAAYNTSLAGKPYMMPVSPWFFTNMPGFDKNWLWNSGDLWYERWKEVWSFRPEFVEIISWNDFGESHYIGGLDDRQYEAFGEDRGNSPYNYAEGMPHDGWREHLPYVIDVYTKGSALFNQESLVTWFRTSLASSCSDGGTTGNTASQLQIEFQPADLMPDRIYITALLSSAAKLTINYDSDADYGSGSYIVDEWDYTPDGGVGLYHTSISVTAPKNSGGISESADITFTEISLSRGGSKFLSFTPEQGISATCTNDITNWNAWVGSKRAEVSEAVEAPRTLDEMVCTQGTSVGDFKEICEFTCKYGYCPPGACVCTNLGKQREYPQDWEGITVWPANGDANFGGLCMFACNYGKCLDVCSRTETAAYVPTVSPFNPDVCVGGSGTGDYEELCEYACQYGFCPIHHCTCTAQGALVEPPAQVNAAAATYLLKDDADLCKFACTRGSCPSVCAQALPNFDATCNTEQRAMITAEWQRARDIALAAATGLGDGVYYETFFPPSLRNQATFYKKTVDRYSRLSNMLGTLSIGPINVSCDFKTKYCLKKSWVAHMNDEKSQMNFCSKWFNDQEGEVRGTKELIDNNCGMNLTVAQHSRSAVILHECTHTKFAMGDERTVDYAYGPTDCSKLAMGAFNKDCPSYNKKRCPDDICDPNLAEYNADTYTVIGAGIYYSQQCGTPIPLRSPAAKLKTRTLQHPHVQMLSRNNACPYNDDYLNIDGDTDADDAADSLLSIPGYVHFGDSYGAGMGTGTTSGDSCRVGSSNFGQLLYNWFENSSIPFENKVCSGDTTTGLAKRIAEWETPTVPTIGTVSIGGNDVGFSDIVWNCILTPNYWHFPATYRQNCLTAEQKARDMMASTGTDGLRYKLKESYKKILAASGRADFHLYVTGYPAFFNSDTEDCDQSTFHYWFARYKPDTLHPNYKDMVLLTQDLRVELNDLVALINTVIEEAVSDASSEWGGNQVHYVDVQSQFDSHRWCEAGVHEPDSTRQDTWFFLSAWPDASTANSADTTAQVEASEVAALINSGSIALPDASTCESNLGTDPDPYAVAMCRVAIAVSEEPSGLEAERLVAANNDIASGNYSSQNIPWYAPTRQIKTFHPRTAGMEAYRDAIVSAIQDIGQL